MRHLGVRRMPAQHKPDLCGMHCTVVQESAGEAASIHLQARNPAGRRGGSNEAAIPHLQALVLEDLLNHCLPAELGRQVGGHGGAEAALHGGGAATQEGPGQEQKQGAALKGRARR